MGKSLYIVGNLYRCPEYYLLIYPTKESMSLNDPSPAAEIYDQALAFANYWSKDLECQVRFSRPNEVFMLLKRDGRYLYVLFGEKPGWILGTNWLGIKRAQNEKNDI